MKRFVILSILITLAYCGKAQWTVKTIDNGFDEPQFEATAPSNDKSAKLAMVVLDNRVVLAVETPDIWYRNNYNNVILTFKINGENKEYKLRGLASKESSMLFIVPSGGGIKQIGDLLQGQFLADFKSATAMKLQITYGASYEYETYVFKMNGSTASYNKVASQAKPELNNKQESTTQPIEQSQTNSNEQTKSTIDDNDEVFTVVEEDPEFPGGMEAMYKFIADNLSYPSLAKDNNITGRVFVSFVVEKDGSISNVKTMRDIGGGCGAEACRIIRSMPNWIPGKQRGKIVRVQYTLPVNFNLN